MQTNVPYKAASPGKPERGFTLAERGFTLIETVIMLAIVAMIALVAIPNLQRVKVKTGTLQALLNAKGTFDLARSEAVRRHSPVAIVYSPGPPRILMVWEDWDPNNDASLGTNANGAHDGAEDVIARKFFPTEIAVIAQPSGDTSTLPNLAVTSYGSDGALSGGATGGVVHLGDKAGNIFRIRVNSVTGATRLEGWIAGSNKWEGKREKWSWVY